MRILRLLVTKQDDRPYPACCNKQWDLDALEYPSFAELDSYAQICITGGEPLLYPDRVESLISLIKACAPEAEIIIYTAYAKRSLNIIDYVDGLTLALHSQSDVLDFLELNNKLNAKVGNEIYSWLRNKTLRLNVFSDVKLPVDIDLSKWQVKDNKERVEECPLPKDEVFKKFLLF